VYGKLGVNGLAKKVKKNVLWINVWVVYAFNVKINYYTIKGLFLPFLCKNLTFYCVQLLKICNLRLIFKFLTNGIVNLSPTCLTVSKSKITNYGIKSV